MESLARVGRKLQQVFGDLAQQAADESGVIQRIRKFTARSLAQTFIWGFLSDPRASDEKLAQRAAEFGAEVTPQAIDQRQTPELVSFLQKLFCQVTQLVIGAEKALAPLLERFTSVTLLDTP